MDTIKPFFPKIRVFSMFKNYGTFDAQKKAGETYLHNPPASCATEC